MLRDTGRHAVLDPPGSVPVSLYMQAHRSHSNLPDITRINHEQMEEAGWLCFSLLANGTRSAKSTHQQGSAAHIYRF